MPDTVRILYHKVDKTTANVLRTQIGSRSTFDVVTTVSPQNQSVLQLNNDERVLIVVSPQSFDGPDYSFYHFCRSQSLSPLNVLFFSCGGLNTSEVDFLKNQQVFSDDDIQQSISAILDYWNSSSTSPHQVSNKYLLDDAPPIPSIRYGKKQILKELVKRLVSNEIRRNAISICGFNGAGKSTAIRAFIEDYGGKFSHICWISFKHCRKPIDVVGEIMRIPGLVAEGLLISDAKPYQVIFQAMKNNDILLVFDNFEKADTSEFIDLFERLCKEDLAGRLIITTTKPIPEFSTNPYFSKQIEELEYIPLSNEEYIKVALSFDINLSATEVAAVRRQLGDNFSSWIKFLVEISEAHLVVSHLLQKPMYFDKYKPENIEAYLVSLPTGHRSVFVVLAVSGEGLTEPDLISKLANSKFSGHIQRTIEEVKRNPLISLRTDGIIGLLDWAVDPVLETISNWFADELFDIFSKEPTNLISFLIVNPHASEYIQEHQNTNLLARICDQLRQKIGTEAKCHEHIENAILKDLPWSSIGFLGSNLLAIFRGFSASLENLNFEKKVFNGADFSRTSLKSTSFVKCDLINCLFADSFGPVTAIAVIGSGNQRYIIAGTFLGELRIWTREGQAAATLRCSDDWISCLIPDQFDSSCLFVSSVDGRVSRVNIHTHSIEPIIDIADHKIRSITQTRNGTIWCACDDGIVRVISHEKKLIEIELSDMRLLSCQSVEMNGREIVLIGGDQSCLWVIDDETRSVYAELNLGQFRTRDICVSLDGRSIYIAHEFEVSQWKFNAENGDWCRLRIYEIGSRIWSIIYDGSDQQLYVGSSDAKIHVLSASDLTPIRILNGHTSWVRTLTFDIENHEVLSGSEDQSIRIWTKSSFRCEKVLHGLGRRIFSVTCTSGKAFFGTADHRVMQVTITKNGILRNPVELYQHNDQVFVLSSSKSGDLVGSASDDGTIVVWQTREKKRIFESHHHMGWIGSLAFSPDERLIASGGDDGVLCIIDLEQRGKIYFERLTRGRISGLGFISNAEIIAISEVGMAYLINLSTKSTKAVKVCNQLLYSFGILSNLDAHIICGNSIGELYSVKLKEDSVKRVFDIDGNHPIWCLKVEASSQKIALGIDDGRLLVLDQGFKKIREISEAHVGQVWSVDWIKQGNGIVTTGGDGSVAYWEIQNSEKKHRIFAQRLYEGSNFISCTGIGPAQVQILENLGANVK